MARAEPVAQHGWFPDPEEPGRLRMWDGKAWTSLTKYPGPGDVVSGPAPSGPLPPRPAPRSTVDPAPQSRPRPTRSPLDLAASSAVPSPAPTAPSAHGWAEAEPSEATPASLVSENLASVITLGVALVCIVVASTAGYPVIAIAPALVAMRAFAVREAMAPLAALAATAAAIIGLVLLAK